MPHPSLPGRLITVVALAVIAGCSQVQQAPQPVAVNIVAINDLHGYLQASTFSYSDANGAHEVRAGGVATLGGMLIQLRKQDPQLLFIGAGDLVGASPPLSSMWADEPTLQALRDMGMNLSVIGNHELDNGKAEFLRQLNGGCESSRPAKACQFRPTYGGSGFPYIAANLIDTDTGKSLLPPYRIETVNGVKVAFVGAVLRDVASVVSAKGMQGLSVQDEADAINKLIPELHAQGANANVAVVHQGGSTPEAFDQQDCQHLSGDIVDVAKRLDPAVDVLISAHSHQGYLCKVGPLLVTQGSSFGHFLTHLTLDVTPGQHHVTRIQSTNLLADPSQYPADPKLAALQHEVETRSDAVLLKPIGAIAVASIKRALDDSGESPLGDLIADVQLALGAKDGAQIGFTNTGGIRNDLTLEPGQRKLNFAQVATVQPFENDVITFDLSGRQLEEVLNLQWKADEDVNFLQVSKGFTYRWDASRPLSNRVVPGSIQLNGKPLKPEGHYRVVMNSFLAAGGDRFPLFKEGLNRRNLGITDQDALIDYLKTMDQQGLPVGAAKSAGRIVRVN